MQGVYHQAKELHRVLSINHNATLHLFQYLPAPDPADDDAVFIIMPAYSASMLPPQYILYQTEQWGHYSLDPLTPIWANQRGNTSRQTTLDAFEVSCHSVL